MVKLQQLLVSLAIAAAAMTMADTSAQNVAADNQREDSDSSLGESDSRDGSAFFSSDSDSFADGVGNTSTISSDGESAAGEVTIQPGTPTPSPTSPPTAQPVVDGVPMFGQCGGVFYSGSTMCTDPDAYCKELSIYSSICAPKPVN
ncbi:Small cellulose binding protein [Phytophthora cinnamomi]|uniref:Small cellulose binding protein n=1 Tax=Phytophthora cinnamomi TaxID=4785 RepID=UPI0035596F39|nr:Small cellulose binding protein [Phytophthora cinnamomi]